MPPGRISGRPAWRGRGQGPCAGRRPLCRNPVGSRPTPSPAASIPVPGWTVSPELPVALFGSRVSATVTSSDAATPEQGGPPANAAAVLQGEEADGGKAV